MRRTRALGQSFMPWRRAAAHLVVRRVLRVAAAGLAANVLPALHDAGVLEGAPKHLLKRRVTTQHPSLSVRKHQAEGDAFSAARRYGTSSAAIGIASACPPFVVSRS